MSRDLARSRSAQPALSPAPDLSQFHDDLKATLAAWRELDPSMQPTLVESAVERMQRAIDARVEARVAAATRYQRKGRQRGLSTGTVAASMALSIPLIAIAGRIADAPGIIMVLVMVVLLNIIELLR